jgi:hypothetical protein
MTTVGGSGGYGGGSGSSRGSQQITIAPLLVRADITYMRQDFSVQQPSAPVLLGTDVTVGLRFDYLVRTRTVTESALRKLRTSSYQEAKGQHRQAVLFALRELTGQDLGGTYEQWKTLLPPGEPNAGAEATRLAGQLLNAPDSRKERALARLRDGKGGCLYGGLGRGHPKA